MQRNCFAKVFLLAHKLSKKSRVLFFKKKRKKKENTSPCILNLGCHLNLSECANKLREKAKATQNDKKKKGKSQREGEKEEQMDGGKQRRAVGPVKLLTSWCEPRALGGTRNEWTYLA